MAMVDLATRGPPTTEILYQTHSICPLCALIDRKGMTWIPADVARRDIQVILQIKCKKHPNLEVLYSNNFYFVQKMMSFTPSARLPNPGPADIEDMKSRVDNITPQNAPLVIELNLFERDAFVPDDILTANLEQQQRLLPAGKTCLLKLLAGMALDMEGLNERVLRVLQMLPRNYVLLELTFDRLVLISRLENSCLLKSAVTPSVTHYFQSGSETQCLRELEALAENLSTIAGIQLMLNIVIERPFPQLDGLIAFVRAHQQLVRVVNFSLERSPMALMSKLTALNRVLSKASNSPKPKSATGGESEAATPPPSPAKGAQESAAAAAGATPECSLGVVDPFDLLMHIEEQSDQFLAATDFFPVSIGRALEPFLQMIGFGSLNIRPSPFCGFVAAMVNITGAPNSINRLIDMEVLYRGILPEAEKLEKGDTLGIMMSRRVKKALEAATRPGVVLPDILSYVTSRDQGKLASARGLLGDTQFFIIHNNMDMASLDLHRRCQCSSLAPGTGKLVSACTGCL